MSHTIFHLSFPVTNLDATKQFYVNGLGCTLGRESHVALTLELGGHQLVAQLCKDLVQQQQGIYPRHFGLVLDSEAAWQHIRDRAKAHGLKFFREPYRRYSGKRIEHQTFFLEDPSHNILEFKHYTYESAIFGEHDHATIGDDQERRSP
ncbi:MAG: glyoxalase [Nitrospirales bacterium]|nr:glyoxalase [Nitrospirales bacterium]